MDRPYFLAARRLLLESDRSMGYAIGLPPEVLAGCTDGSCIDWDGVSDVTCQMTAVVAGFGPAADPEEFYRQHSVTGLRGLLYERHTSQEMTGRAERIRRGGKRCDESRKKSSKPGLTRMGACGSIGIPR